MRKMVERLRTLVTWLFGAVVFGLVLFSKPQVETISPLLDGALMVVACCGAAIGAIGRVWASLYLGGYKNTKLITVGPYSICRNPLYFFSFIGAVGVGCATETFTIPLVIIAMFLLYYPFVVKAEEKRLASIFGQEFEEYKKTTPAIIPNWSRKIVTPESWNVNPRLFARRSFDALWFIFFIGFLEFVEELRAVGAIPTFFKLY